MDDDIDEFRPWKKGHLGTLLNLKRDNKGTEIVGLQRMIADAIVVMAPEDVAYVEKIVGEKAL